MNQRLENNTYIKKKRYPIKGRNICISHALQGVKISKIQRLYLTKQLKKKGQPYFLGEGLFWAIPN